MIRSSQYLNLSKMSTKRRLGEYNNWYVLFGRIILVSACYIVLYLFLYHFRREVLEDFYKTFFIILIILLFVGITRLVSAIPTLSIYLVPIAMIPIVVRTFYDSRLALFIHLIAIMLAGFFVPNSFDFVFISFIVGVVAIFSLTNVYRRA